MTGIAPPPPPRKPRTSLVVGLAAVAVLGVAGIVFAVTSTGGSSKVASPAASSSDTSAADAGGGAVHIPTSAGGLSQLTGRAGQVVTNTMKKLDSISPLLSGALFGAYAKSGSSTYFSNLTLVPLSGAPSLKSALSHSDPATFIAGIAQSAGVDNPVPEPAAGSGSVMTCGFSDAENRRMCLWIDNDEYGLAVYPRSVSNDQAAAYSDALWKASERA